MRLLPKAGDGGGWKDKGVGVGVREGEVPLGVHPSCGSDLRTQLVFPIREPIGKAGGRTPIEPQTETTNLAVFQRNT